MSKRPRGSTTGISLFAFLDVLICTMGSLIILLALFIQSANDNAVTEVAAERETASTDSGRFQAEKEEHEWRQQILEQQRTEKTQELSDATDRLSHLEDHIRRLKTHAEDLLKLAADIDRGKQLKDDERAAAQQELEKTRALIEQLKKDADLARKKLQSAQRWFALIPYDGPNGTRRRPIYIECTEVGITLQPEGITLMPDDFSGPLGPGNPLDAALRAKREYLNRAGETATPYPLLVVRPDGVVAYSVARAAMKSWDDEFGYELIDGEKKLVFGDPDPALASLVQSTVRSARQRQAALASSVPRNFKSEDTVSSFRPEDVLPTPPSDATGSGLGRGTGGSGRGIGGTGNSGGTGYGPGSGTGGDPLGGPVPNGTKAGKGTGTSPQGGGTGGAYAKGGNGGATGTGTAGGGTGTNSGAAGATGAGGNSATGEQTGASGQPGSGGTGGNVSLGSAGAMVGSSGGTGNLRDPGQSADGSSNGASGAAAGSYSGSPSGSAGGGESSGESTPSGMANMSSSGKKASRRGQNWGLPNARTHATAITRPIRVVLQKDKVVIMPERGDDRLPKEIPLKGTQMTPQEADQVVSAVQKHMQWWGVAVENGYWKPLLNVEVSPAADERFRQVETALQGSGFEMQRKVR